MKFRLLGPLEIEVPNSSPISVAGPQQRAMLAVLLLNVGKVVSSWDLMAEMWPGRENTRRNNLHAQVSRLRRTVRRLPLYSCSAGYVLDVDPNEIDATRFRRLVGRGRTLAGHDPRNAAVVLTKALGLWRGHALQDAQLGGRCQAAANSLEAARLLVREELADLNVCNGDPMAAIDDLQELALLHPLRETVQARLMAALHACGRSAEAVHLYAEVRGRFNDRLGCEPGEAMRQQLLAILQALRA